MMFMKKNGAVISVIALLLFVAMYLNWQYGRVEVSELVNAERNEENRKLYRVRTVHEKMSVRA